MHDELPEIPHDAGERDAIISPRNVTKWLGAGFHPDSRGEDNVCVDDDRPTFEPEDAVKFNCDLDKSFELLAERGRNSYDVAIKVQRRLLGIGLTRLV